MLGDLCIVADPLVPDKRYCWFYQGELVAAVSPRQTVSGHVDELRVSPAEFEKIARELCTPANASS